MLTPDLTNTSDSRLRDMRNVAGCIFNTGCICVGMGVSAVVFNLRPVLDGPFTLVMIGVAILNAIALVVESKAEYEIDRRYQRALNKLVHKQRVIDSNMDMLDRVQREAYSLRNRGKGAI